MGDQEESNGGGSGQLNSYHAYVKVQRKMMGIEKSSASAMAEIRAKWKEVNDKEKETFKKLAHSLNNSKSSHESVIANFIEEQNQKEKERKEKKEKEKKEKAEKEKKPKENEKKDVEKKEVEKIEKTKEKESKSESSKPTETNSSSKTTTTENVRIRLDSPEKEKKSKSEKTEKPTTEKEREKEKETKKESKPIEIKPTKSSTTTTENVRIRLDSPEKEKKSKTEKSDKTTTEIKSTKSSTTTTENVRIRLDSPEKEKKSKTEKSEKTEKTIEKETKVEKETKPIETKSIKSPTNDNIVRKRFGSPERERRTSSPELVRIKLDSLQKEKPTETTTTTSKPITIIKRAFPEESKDNKKKLIDDDSGVDSLTSKIGSLNISKKRSFEEDEKSQTNLSQPQQKKPSESDALLDLLCQTLSKKLKVNAEATTKEELVKSILQSFEDNEWNRKTHVQALESKLSDAKVKIDKKSAELKQISANSRSENEFLTQKLNENTQKATKLERELELLKSKSMQQTPKPIPQQLHPVTNQPIQNSLLLTSKTQNNQTNTKQTSSPQTSPSTNKSVLPTVISSSLANTMMVVVDTNVFMQTENLSSLWLIDHIVVIPFVVMRELDGLKTNERTSERARRATRHLEEMVGNPRCLGQSIHEVLTGSNIIPPANNDEHIVNCAMFFANLHPHKRIAVLSDDVNLRLKAKSNKIEAFGAKDYFGPLYVQPAELNRPMKFETGTKKPFQQQQHHSSNNSNHSNNYQQHNNNSNHRKSYYQNHHNYSSNNNGHQTTFSSPQPHNNNHNNNNNWMNNQKNFEFGNQHYQQQQQHFVK